MSVPLYTDHNVNRAVVQGLRLRGVDLLTAYEDLELVAIAAEPGELEGTMLYLPLRSGS